MTFAASRMSSPSKLRLASSGAAAVEAAGGFVLTKTPVPGKSLGFSGAAASGARLGWGARGWEARSAVRRDRNPRDGPFGASAAGGESPSPAQEAARKAAATTAVREAIGQRTLKKSPGGVFDGKRIGILSHSVRRLASAGRATTGQELPPASASGRRGRLCLAGGISELRRGPRRGQHHRRGIQVRIGPGSGGHRPRSLPSRAGRWRARPERAHRVGPRPDGTP